MALPPPDFHSTCLVTGASSGIGADVARSLARRGQGVTLVARRAERLNELAGELRSEHEIRVEMVRLNMEAVVALCARFVPEMVRRGRGGVLNVASMAAFQPLPRQATYAATKAFVLSFTDALHADLAGTGVTATALCPGPVKTEFADSAGISAEAEGLPEMVWAESPEVAEQGVRGLERGKRVVVPGGLVNRATALGGQHVPRSVLLRVAGRFNPLDR